MAYKYVRIDITNNPELRSIAEAVKHSRTPHLLAEADEELAVVMPLTDASGTEHATRRRRQARGGFTRNDALFGLIGVGAGKTPGGVSGNKHEGLARAYRPK